MGTYICIATGTRRECIGCAAGVPYEGKVNLIDVSMAMLKCPSFDEVQWADLPILTATHLITKQIVEYKVPARAIGDTGLYVHGTWDNRNMCFMGNGLWTISTIEGYRVISNTGEMTEAAFLNSCAPLFALTGWEDHIALLLGEGEHKKLMNQLKKVCGFI